MEYTNKEKELIRILSGDNIPKIRFEKNDLSENICFLNGLMVTKFELLALALKLEGKSYEIAFKLVSLSLNLYENDSDETFLLISEAVKCYICYENIRKDELFYQEVFKKNCKKILGAEYEYYDRKDLFLKRPDGWVKRNQDIIPVEMKLGNFDQSALKQLNGYMKLYKSDYGIAIGKEQTVELPCNIKFLNIDEIKKYEEN